MIKITPELLEKYSEGKCSKQELEAIDSWLETTDEEMHNLNSNELKSMKDEIWENLNNILFPYQLPLHKRFYQYAAGIAAIAVTASTIFFFLPQNTSHAKANFSNFSKTNNKVASSAGLQFLLRPESSISSNTSISKAVSELGFCGFVELTNTNMDDIQAKIMADCSESTLAIKELKLRKGTTYLLFTNSFKKEKEVYVINEQRLHELPLPLWNKVLDQFDK